MKKWTDALNTDVYQRLCACCSTKDDIITLTQAKWASLKQKQGYTKEDALISVLELLDCNSICFDLTTEEYENILHEII